MKARRRRTKNRRRRTSTRQWLFRAPGTLTTPMLGLPPKLGLPPTAVGPTYAESEATGLPLVAPAESDSTGLPLITPGESDATGLPLVAPVAESETTGQPLIMTTPQVGPTAPNNDVVVVSVQVKPASEVQGVP